MFGRKKQKITQDVLTATGMVHERYCLACNTMAKGHSMPLWIEGRFEYGFYCFNCKKTIVISNDGESYAIVRE